MDRASTPESPHESTEPPGDAPHDASPESELEEVRALLFANERRKLERLETKVTRHLPLTPGRLGRILPDALTWSDEQDARLRRSLRTPITETLQDSVRRDPQTMADALFPVMGPAIRRSIAHTVQSMVQSFNQTLEYGLSPRGLGWRIQAWRTGRPFGEVVLLNTLRYRVEMALLVQRESGVLLRALGPDLQDIPDADLIGGMLTALQDFCRDSLPEDNEDSKEASDGEALDSFRYRSRTVYVETGRHAQLAVVVEGNPPTGLREVRRELLREIHAAFAVELERFDGRVEALAGCDEYLAECFTPLDTGAASSQSRSKPWPLIAASLGLLALLTWWIVSTVQDRSFESRVREQIAGTPGYQVHDSRWEGSNLVLQGLRDRDAPELAQLLQNGKLDHRRVQGEWMPVLSTEDALIEARIRRLLQLPDTVTVESEEGRVSLTGHADWPWLATLDSDLGRIHGVESLDVADLFLAAEGARGDAFTDALLTLERWIPSVEAVRVNEANPHLRATAVDINDYVAAARDAGIDPSVEMVISEPAFDQAHGAEGRVDTTQLLSDLKRELEEHGVAEEILSTMHATSVGHLERYGLTVDDASQARIWLRGKAPEARWIRRQRKAP